MDYFKAEELVANYENLRNRINTYFKNNEGRLDTLNKMYDHFEDRIIYTPASSKKHFHNAFPGGYIDHVLRVTDNVILIYKLYSDMGIDVSKINRESLLFCALHHDLGKLGSVDDDLYIINDSEWHVKNQGKIYKINEKLHWMDCNTRSFYLLNHFGVKCTEEEWLGIKLTDGLYDESNKEYFINYDTACILKTTLPYILHQADMNAVRFEVERLEKNGNL